MALLCLRENGHHWKEINYKLFVEQKDILDSSESMLPVEGSVTDPIEYILQCKTPTNRPNLWHTTSSPAVDVSVRLVEMSEHFFEMPQ